MSWERTERTRASRVHCVRGLCCPCRSCFGGELNTPDYDNVPSAVFCTPPMATGEPHFLQMPPAFRPKPGLVFSSSCLHRCLAWLHLRTCSAAACSLRHPTVRAYPPAVRPVLTCSHVPHPLYCLCCTAVGYSEEEAVEKLEGDIDVYVSKFRPMK